jgi:alkaline phosphatase
MRRSTSVLLAAALVCGAVTAPAAGAPLARNVILFVGDAGGLSTISAAAIEAGRPQQLYIQKMPHLGLMDTSAADAWVTDSAAAMSAIVTGRKTNNGVLSQSAEAVKGVSDGRPLKTILEYAEEHGLSTGVVTNSPAVDATPAACYAHVNDRGNAGEVVAQLLAPRVGDGVDVVIGAGRQAILKAAADRGIDLEHEARRRGYELWRGLEAGPDGAPLAAGAPRRLIVLLDDGGFDLAAAAELARRILSRNPKGFFLMVESDLHANDVGRAFRRTIELDGLIERTVRAAGPRTLVIFTADHSYDLRLRSGRRGESLLSGLDGPRPALRQTPGAHTGEEVLVSATGPGSERVSGFFSNTQLFDVMLDAFGWKPSPFADR